MSRGRWIAAAAVLLVSGAAFACSCRARGPIEPDFDAADAVFLGAVRPTPIIDTWFGGLIGFFMGMSFGSRTYTVDVRSSWKGVATSRVDVTTGLGGGDCGVRFWDGAERVIFAQDDHGTLRTHVCTRTRELPATEELAFLASKPVLPLSPTSIWWPLARWTAALAGFGAAIAWWLRRSARKHVAPQPKTG